MPNSLPPSRRSLAVCLGLAACVTLPACTPVDDGPADGSDRRAPVNPGQPTNATVDRLSVSSSWPEDSDANGYPDLITVTVYMFDSRQSYVSLHSPGIFTAKLISPENKDVRTWTLTEEQTERAVRRLAVGPGYVFSLNLNENGGDVLPTQAVDLIVTFVPKKGEPVRSRGATSLRIGKGGAGGAR
jgi:hypothetical protein